MAPPPPPPQSSLSFTVELLIGHCFVEFVLNGLSIEGYYVGLKNIVFWGVFMVVSMMDIFWDFLPCFGITYRFHLKGNEALESAQLLARICIS
jgi:hypothetical protein